MNFNLQRTTYLVLWKHSLTSWHSCYPWKSDIASEVGMCQEINDLLGWWTKLYKTVSFIPSRRNFLSSGTWMQSACSGTLMCLLIKVPCSIDVCAPEEAMSKTSTANMPYPGNGNLDTRIQYLHNCIVFWFWYAHEMHFLVWIQTEISFFSDSQKILLFR